MPNYVLKFPRGSEWRRWDLHVHTPFSALNNGFGNDFEAYAVELFRRAIERDIAVIGLTDYFSVEGYRKLRLLTADANGRLEELLGDEAAKRARSILLLPNIEFRTSVIINHPGGETRRVGFHVIFSDSVDPETIEEHFLRQLRFTAEADPSGQNERWPVTRPNLEELGKRLKLAHEPFRDRSDLHIGMTNAVVSFEDVATALKDQPSRFKDRFLIVVPADEDLSRCSWDSQAHLTRKLFIQQAHLLFSGNAATREFGLGRKHERIQDFVREFGRPKACIHGSDAHSVGALFEPDGNRYCWIKADPTFLGLYQLVHEPADRVFLGTQPPSLSHVRENATKYIAAVTFDRLGATRPEEIWFSGRVQLNDGLVAVIGNKGSGKSALADIIALLANTRNSEHFAFLSRDRFLAPKARLGELFRAKLTWLSGPGRERLLGDPVDETLPELAKYIPQNYLETICTELKQSRESRFDQELMEVIFSHVGDEARLGKDSLPELLQYLTSEKEGRILQVGAELSSVNAAIVALEEQALPGHRKILESQLAQRRAELLAHDGAKPLEVSQPRRDGDEDPASGDVRRELVELVEQWKAIDAEITAAKDEAKVVALRSAAADRLLKRIENLERDVASFRADSAADATVLELDIEQVVTLTVVRQPVLRAKNAAGDRARVLSELLDEEHVGSLAHRKQDIVKKTEAVRATLAEPERRYEEYLRQLAEWDKRRQGIEGAPTIRESLKGLESQLSALEQVPGEIARLKGIRAGLVREIVVVKQQLLDDYRRLYAPVQRFIDTHPVSQQQGALEFSASIVDDNLVEGLLAFLHQGRKGSFQGEQEGRARLREISARSDLSTVAGIEALLADVQDHLDSDKREEPNKTVQLREQLRGGKTVLDVYNFLYNLSFLRPRFELRWQGKPLDQLSPGERGNLLLVFYLLIDKRDIPLMIDQPEENLDNQTVARMLVPAIKYAKVRRQVVLVTHNPNLAVVCDADQVIHAQLDKTDGNRVTYTSGAIEDPVITRLIVDVLEGTMPAFDLRDAKYGLLERDA